MPNLTGTQVNELYAIHADLAKLHARASAITESLHKGGGLAGSILPVQLSITAAMQAVSDALDESIYRGA